jgi:hypothetical protein
MFARFMLTRGKSRLLGSALVLCVFACSDSPTVPQDAPDGHTVVKSGVAHAPGLNNPTVNCVLCHGADLRGGPGGQPSCFTCHGQKW